MCRAVLGGRRGAGTGRHGAGTGHHGASCAVVRDRQALRAVCLGRVACGRWSMKSCWFVEFLVLD